MEIITKEFKKNDTNRTAMNYVNTLLTRYEGYEISWDINENDGKTLLTFIVHSKILH